MMSPTVVAVDLGGSRLRLAATDVKGKCIEWEKKTVSPTDLPAVLKRTWKRGGWGEVERLIVGSKGVWTRAERHAMKKALFGLAKTITVMSDIELALHGAFAPYSPPIPKMMIVAGTGSMALGITEKDRLIRAGGLGPANGDEGSGWWIGKQWMEKMGREKRGRQTSSVRPSVRQIAGLAKRVIARAATDPACAKIVGEAQRHLARLGWEVAEKMNPRSPILLSWGGSLLENPAFRAGVMTALRKQSPHRFRFVPPGDSPARTASLHPNLFPNNPPRHIPSRRSPGFPS